MNDPGFPPSHQAGPPSLTPAQRPLPPGYGVHENVNRGGNGGGLTIAFGAIMLIAGIGLSMSGIGRVFIGLMVVGVITIIRGIARAASSG